MKEVQKLETRTSLILKIFLTVYAIFIILVGNLSLTYVIILDGMFWIISVSCSACYIYHIKTRSVIELTILDRNIIKKLDLKS